MNDSQIDALIGRFGSVMEDCLKIRAICEDLGYSWEKSTLQTEIHHLALRFGQDLEQTVHQRQDVHAAALRTIRNGSAKDQIEADLVDELLEHPETPPEELKGWQSQEIADALVVGPQLDVLDQQLARRGAMSQFFHTQLEQSGRLYTDSSFRRDELRFYFEQIVPRLDQYTRDDIRRVFP